MANINFHSKSSSVAFLGTPIPINKAKNSEPNLNYDKLNIKKYLV
jgi:hypothetical protein